MILDVSVRQTKTGKRLVDTIKKELVSFVRTFNDGEEFYLYHPDVIDILPDRGEQIGVIANYETDGYHLADMSFAFKQTFYILASSDSEIKTLCYLTDRFSKTDLVHLKKLFNLNKTLDIVQTPCNFLVVEIGHDQDYQLLRSACKDKTEYLEVSEPQFLSQNLQTYFNKEPV